MSEPARKLGYYPGCSLHGTAKELDLSLKAVAPRLGLELSELNDWACCGSTSAHATNHLLSVTLPARTLALAEAEGHEQVIAPCAACYSRLSTAHHEIKHNEALANKVRGILDRPFANKVAVLNIAQLLLELAGRIKERTVAPLKELKVACYYGCLLVRPPAITKFDDAESPTSMEEVVRATGATPVRWTRRLDCCGGGFSLSRTGSVIRLSRDIITDAKKAGAQTIVVACPMCHSNLDLRQKAMDLDSDMPVLFLTQLVGLALGASRDELGLGRHFIPADTVVACAARAAQATETRGQA